MDEDFDFQAFVLKTLEETETDREAADHIEENFGDDALELTVALYRVMRAAFLEAIEEWESNASYKGYLAFKRDDYGEAAAMRKKFGLPEQGPIPDDIKAYYDNEKLRELVHPQPDNKLLDIVRAKPKEEPE